MCGSRRVPCRRRSEAAQLSSNIDAGYGSFQALFGVSMTVNAGEAVAVIGRERRRQDHAAARHLGLIEPTAGEMTMEGVRCARRRRTRSSRPASRMCPKGRRLFPRLSVEDNLRWARSFRRRAPSSPSGWTFVYDLFPRLQERRNQLAGTLSGGEQQMCAIGAR